MQLTSEREGNAVTENLAADIENTETQDRTCDNTGMNDNEEKSGHTGSTGYSEDSGHAGDSGSAETEPDMEALTGAMEAILFAMGEPVSFEILAKALEVEPEMIPEIAGNLRDQYRPRSRGIELSILEDSLQLNTKGDYYRNLITIASIHEKPVLTGPMMETLSIVAYRQPVTRAEISKIRGVSSDHAVSRLVDFGLIEEAGRLEAPGRPILFVTSKEFLRRFGMESLSQLPEQEMPESLADKKTDDETDIDLAIDANANIEKDINTDIDIDMDHAAESGTDAES